MLRKIVFIVVVGTVCLLTAKAGNSDIAAKNGIIDLTGTDFQNRYLQLNGDWEFYWNTLLSPNDFSKDSNQLKKNFIKVPLTWSSKKAGKYPVKGCATYRLIIKSENKEGIFGIRLHDVFTASKVWFDGKLIYSTGVTGRDKKTSSPGFEYQDIPVYFAKNIHEHELILQVSNFYHTRSGLVKPVKFGSYNALADQTKNNLILNLFIIGIIFFIGLSHLLNYFLYKNEISNLFFGLLCLVMIIRNISTGQRILTYIFPNLNWQLLFKLDNFSGFGTIPLFAILLYILYKKDFPRFFLNLFVSVGALITLFVIFTPQSIYGRFRMFFELYILVGGLSLTFYILLRATFRKREGAFLTFIGFFGLYATAINDVLISMGLVSSVEVAPFGLVSYMLIQSFVLSRGSAMAIEENKKLGLALNKEKHMLEERVLERTRELEIRNDEIIKNQEELKNQLWINESLASINAILNKNNKNNIKALSKLVLDEILNLTGSNVGVIYVLDEKKGVASLRLHAAKNASREIMSKTTIEVGEGLIGTCFQQMKLMKISNVSDTYMKLDSGLGEAKLNNLVLIPLHTNQIPVGVIELASMNELSEAQLLLLENISESIASTLRFIKLNNQNVELLEEFRKKENQIDEMEFRKKEEELRALNEEMEILKSQN